MLLELESAADTDMFKGQASLQFAANVRVAWQLLAMQFVQFRLVLELIHLAHATLHEQENATFRAPWKMRNARCKWVAGIRLNRVVLRQ